MGIGSTNRKKYAFDTVLSESSTNYDVFVNTSKKVSHLILSGINTTVFAYGTTGAGKTHTMLGTKNEPGIMYFTLKELFKHIE